MSSDFQQPASRRRLSFNRRSGGAGHGAPGRVRWGRFGLIFLPAAGLSAGLLVLTANGALATSISISGQEGEVSASQLTGTGFQQFGTVDVPKSGVNGASLIPVTESEIGKASITDLCQSLDVKTVIGDLTLRITGGDAGTPATASSLIIDANQLSGSTATFTNIEQGIDASALSEVPSAPLGIAGNYAQQADTIKITNLEQVAYSTTAGTFTLPDFKLSLDTGDNPCFSSGNVINNFNL